MQTSKDQSLIMPGRSEALFEKINSFKVNNLTAKESKMLQEKNCEFIIFFVKLCWKHFGISMAQLKQLDKSELTELSNIIYQKTKNTALAQSILLFLLLFIPVFGWCAIGIMMDTDLLWASKYRNLYNKLSKPYVQDYFPFDALKNRIG